LFSGLTNFAELEQKIAALPDEKARGDAFEVFAEAYLATQRKHDAAHVWPHGSVPLDILKNLGLTQSDQGVDGVLQTLLGEFDAYQVKFRTGRPSLTWRELSTFIGLADSPCIHIRVLLTNCDELPAVLNDRQGFFCIRGADLDRMEADDFRAIEAWLADAAYTAPKKTPQLHQTEALDALLPALQTHNRVSAIMACGTGKTLVALWIAENVARASSPASSGGVPAARILVLLPSLALLRQTLHEWLRETSLPSLAYLCICSDPTVKEGIDALNTQQSDLDFQVSTDAASVRSFLDAPFAGVKLIFSTYQSASVVGAAMKPGEAFDFAVFDEAHKTAGREGRNFALALNNKKLSIRKRLFMTATPRHYNPQKRDREGEAELVFSMDNPEVYGPQAYRLTFAEAARRGIICGYKVIISVITSEMVTNDLLSHGEVFVNGDAVRARQVANQIALRDAIEKYGVKKVFTFHRCVKSAQSFVSDGPEGVGTHLADVAADVRRLNLNSPPDTKTGNESQSLVTSTATSKFQTFHVNGSMPTARREREMRDFRAAARAVVSNARCLTEGVDVPAVDMVAFLSPRRSRVDIVQATGRAMRRSPGKTTGYVLVPLYVELTAGESVEAAVNRAQFDEIWDILQSVQEQDDVLAEIIRAMREERGRTKSFDDSRFHEIVEVCGPSISLDKLRTAITTACVDVLGVSWDELFGLLQHYQSREGNCQVPREYLESGLRLGVWVRTQRRQRGRMSADRRQRLETLGFEWDPFAAAWEQGFATLVRFKAREHHCHVPARHLEGIYKLGQWANSQRTQRDSLSVDRRQRLEALGFDWDPLATDWEEGLVALKKFQAREGHCRVPVKHLEGTFRIGQWVSSQRNRKDSIPIEYRQRLEALGFEWDILASAWEAEFAALERFKARENNCRVPVSHIEGTYRLGQWVANQRRQKDSIPVERRLRLEALGFEWNPYAADWEQGFAMLQKFYARERHCQVPAKHLEGTYRLGQWVSDLRKKQNNTPSERRQRLEALGFEWDMLASAWEEGFAALKNFQAREGHCQVPQQHIEGNYRLRSWVGNQRNQKDSMSADRRQRLDALGFIWNSLVAAWEEGFAALQQFQEREGHCKVPQQHIEGTFKLGHWVSHQRSDKDTMQAGRRQRLGALGFVWDSKDAAWDKGFAALKQFKEREGHSRISQKHIEGTYRLGQWAANQRNRRDIMPVERRQRLDALGFEWMAKKETPSLL
jgi:superfamily II DNA or RNA helicase